MRDLWAMMNELQPIVNVIDGTFNFDPWVELSDSLCSKQEEWLKVIVGLFRVLGRWDIRFLIEMLRNPERIKRNVPNASPNGCQHKYLTSGEGQEL
jgi:hypothetical protein